MRAHPMAITATEFTLNPNTNGALVLVLCLLILQGASGTSCFHGCHRKMLQNNVAVKVKGLVHDSTSSSGNGENFMRGELRSAPSGPDPMHHKKPRTDP